MSLATHMEKMLTALIVGALTLIAFGVLRHVSPVAEWIVGAVLLVAIILRLRTVRRRDH